MDPARADVDGPATTSHACGPSRSCLRRCACRELFGRPVATTRLEREYGSPRDDWICGGCDSHRRYAARELRDRGYSGERTAGDAFACRLTGCGHVDSVETIVEHYESAHGPFAAVVPTDPAYPDTVCFVVLTNVEVVKRIFNGYFYFFVKSPTPRQCQNVNVLMVNINPMDRTRYTYTASVGIIKGEMICKISVTLKEQCEDLV